MSRKERPLLPFPKPSEPPPAPQKAVPKSQIIHKRACVTVACNACRAKKIACDAQKPSCARCIQTGAQCCYTKRRTAGEMVEIERENEELRQKQQDLVEIMDMLRSGSGGIQYEILGMLKSNPDPSAILGAIKDSYACKLPQLQSQPPYPLLPGTHATLETELMVRHPFAYPFLKPASLTPDSQPSSMGFGEDILMDGVNTKFSMPSAAGTTLDTDMVVNYGVPRRGQPISSSTSSLESETSQPPLAPATPLSTVYCDNRLHNIRLDQWSRVPVDNIFAASAISLYLESEHPLFGFFDPDLFVTDLSVGRSRFCSSLLVNSLLYRACQMYGAINPSAHHFARAFLEEAERIWSKEQYHNAPDLLTTAVALQLLSLSSLCQGRNEPGLTYLTQGLGMAERLKLLTTNVNDPTTGNPGVASGDESRVQAHSAWGIFVWLMIHSLFYHRPPPVSPPKYPVAGHNFANSNNITSQAQAYASKISPAPYMGETFAAMCRFAEIIHEFTSNYYEPSQIPLTERVTLASAESIYQKLLAWGDVLPPCLARSEYSHDHVVIFHTWYHIAILDILRPFLKTSLHFRTFMALDGSPIDAFRASLEQLKYIVRTQPPRYPSRTYNISWQTAYMYVANAMLSDPESPDRRDYFLLCVRGYIALSRQFEVSGAIVQGLLSMAIEKGLVSAAECSLLLEELRREMHGYDETLSSPDTVRVSFPVNFELSMSDPDMTTRSQLASRLGEQVSFETFTTGGDFNMASMT